MAFLLTVPKVLETCDSLTFRGLRNRVICALPKLLFENGEERVLGSLRITMPTGELSVIPVYPNK